MKFTNKSKQLMRFFTENKYISPIKNNNKTNQILLKIYYDIFDAYQFLQKIKSNKSNNNIYNLNIKKINTSYEVTKPQNFNFKSFPEIVRKHIDEMSFSEITYNFSILGRNCKVLFIVEESNIELKVNKFNKYIDNIIMWLYVLNLYSSKTCASSLIIYFYFTTLEKKLPSSNIFILDETHVNTAFTSTCPKDSEIVIFRKEEWFKVFIHETFHNFGLDFSDMNNDNCHNYIRSIFNVNSEVNAYEAYTEFWAEIINCCFCSFHFLKVKDDTKEFLKNTEVLINFERSYSFFQLVKTLDFMGLDYKNLYSNDSHSKIVRNTLYKEKTNVLAYYFIKTVLINNYQDFLLWCEKNNISLIAFKKTISNQNNFCDFISQHYKRKNMLENIENTKKFINKLHISDKISPKMRAFLLSNLRMTVCELG
jgi:hypothetical protein